MRVPGSPENSVDAVFVRLPHDTCIAAISCKHLEAGTARKAFASTFSSNAIRCAGIVHDRLMLYIPDILTIQNLRPPRPAVPGAVSPTLQAYISPQPFPIRSPSAREAGPSSGVGGELSVHRMSGGLGAIPPHTFAYGESARMLGYFLHTSYIARQLEVAADALNAS